MPPPSPQLAYASVGYASEPPPSSQAANPPLSKQAQALLDLLANLQPARLSSELLLRLLQPFHAKMSSDPNLDPSADAQQRLDRLSPDTQRLLLRLSLSLSGSDAVKEAIRLLSENLGKQPLGRLMEMIGGKNAIHISNANSASLLAKSVAADPGLQALGRGMAPGQILNARVLEQTPEGGLRLQLGNQTLRASLPDLPRLLPGDSLSLQLISLNKTPQLRVLGFSSQNSPENLLLRQLLPRQGSLQQLLQTLNPTPPGSAPGQGQPLPPAQASPLPQPLQQALQQAINQKLNQTLRPTVQPTLQQALNPSAPAQAQPSTNAASVLQQLSGTPLEQNLKPLVEILNNHRLDPDRLSETLVRGLILNSGLFLEANLARKREEPADLKSALLRLVTQLRSGAETQPNNSLVNLLYQRLQPQGDKGSASPLSERQQQLLNQLRGSAEGALAKVEIRQLNSLQQSDDSRQTWQLTLPLLDQQRIKDLELQIQRDKERQEQGGQGDSWTVNLHFDFDSSGPMDVRIQLKQEEIGVVFWAQWPKTLQRLGQLLPKLERSLKKAGLSLTQLSAYPGQAPQHRDDKPRADGPLLSVTA
jgi:hypothetical protein